MGLPPRELHKLPYSNKLGHKMKRGIIPVHWLGDGSGESVPVESDLILWLDASDLSGTLNNNDPVASWEDRSALGNDVAQATEENKPLFKTNQQNSLPVVSFETGEIHQLLNATPDLGDLGTNKDFSIAVIYRVNSTAANSGGFYFAAAPDYGFYFDSTSNIISYRPDGNVPAGYVDVAFDDSNFHLFYFDYRHSDGRARFSIDGGAYNTVTEGTNNPGAGQISLGVSQAVSNCSIGELVAYDVLLSDENITSLWAYLNNKWAVY